MFWVYSGIYIGLGKCSKFSVQKPNLGPSGRLLKLRDCAQKTLRWGPKTFKRPFLIARGLVEAIWYHFWRLHFQPFFQNFGSQTSVSVWGHLLSDSFTFGSEGAGNFVLLVACKTETAKGICEIFQNMLKLRLDLLRKFAELSKKCQN